MQAKVGIEKGFYFHHSWIDYSYRDKYVTIVGLIIVRLQK